MAVLFALTVAAGIAALRVARVGPVRLAGELLPTLAYGTPVFLVALAVAIRTGISLGDDTACFESTVALVVGVWPGAFLGTLLGDALCAERERPYFTMALAKGRSPAAALLIHALPNAIPTVLDAFPQVATALLTGSFAAEKLFNVTYFGFLYVHAALERQGALVVVATTVFASLLVAVTLVARLVRLAVDPRARDAAGAP
jgi:oligopeptide transport system permease protein